MLALVFFLSFSSLVCGLEVGVIVGGRGLMDKLLDCWIDLLGDYCRPTLVLVSCGIASSIQTISSSLFGNDTIQAESQKTGVLVTRILLANKHKI